MSTNIEFETTSANPGESKESTTLLWFDPTIGSREDTEQTKLRLRQINDYIIFQTDLETCVKFIQSAIHEIIFLIVSGSKASELLSHISNLPQIDSIFIFCLKIDRYQFQRKNPNCLSRSETRRRRI